MQIAVIDDGVNAECYPSIGNLAFDVRVIGRGEIEQRILYNKRASSHGTICAAIIKKYAPHANIGSIKILSNKTERGKMNHLVRALDWCGENNIQLVHMSIGSHEIDEIDPIQDAVKKLLSRGTLIVAALSNNMKFSTPASIVADGLFGVKTNLFLESGQFYSNNCGLYDDPFTASSSHLLTDYTGEVHRTQVCNSYAAPLITAEIYSLLQKNPLLTIPQIRKQLGVSENIPSYLVRLSNTKLPNASCKVDIPIIGIYGIKEAAIEVALKLSKLFNKSRYACKVFTSYHENAQADFVPDNYSINAIVKFHSEHLNLCVALFATNKIINLDARITLVPSIHNQNKYNGDHIDIPQKYSEANLRNAMQYLIKLGGKAE